MLRNSLLFTAVLAALAVTACTSDADGTDDTADDTSVDGQALYRDASTDHSGATRSSAAPTPQTATVRIDVRGTGTLDGVEARCALEQASGAFTGRIAGEGRLDDKGLFAALLASGAASFATPSGCAIPRLTVATTTEVVIHAEIAATTENCKAYCEADARAEAEASCGATASAATCRAQAEATAAASCQTTCVAETHHIAADARLSAAALAQLNAAALSGGVLGQVGVDLTFDHVVDGDGVTIGR